MAEKPSSLPRWADSGGLITEPSSGKKDVGWLTGKKVPARWLNWLFNLIYQWTQYLNAPVGTGAGAGISATGGSTSGAGLAGTGGATNGKGVTGTGAGTGAGVAGTGGGTSGTGVTGTGGAPNGGGVIGTATGNGAGVYGSGGSGGGVVGTSTTGGGRGVFGTGHGGGEGGYFQGGAGGNGVTGVAGAGGGSGVAGIGSAAGGYGVFGVGGGGLAGGNFVGDGVAPGVQAQGGGTSGDGASFTGGASNGRGILGTGDGTGAGVAGVGGDSDGVGVTGTGGASNGAGGTFTGVGTGHGAKGLGVNGYGVIAESDTTSPLKAALRVVPQDTVPSSSPSSGDVCNIAGRFSAYVSTQWEKFVQQVGAITAAEDSAATTADTAYTAKVTIKANTLRVGSVIRLHARGRVKTVGGAGTVYFYVSLGGGTWAQTSLRTVASGEHWEMEALATVRSLGGSGSVRSSGETFFGTDTAQDRYSRQDTQVVDTTADIDVQVRYDLSSSTDVVTLEQLAVDCT